MALLNCSIKPVSQKRLSVLDLRFWNFEPSFRLQCFKNLQFNSFICCRMLTLERQALLTYRLHLRAAWASSSASFPQNIVSAQYINFFFSFKNCHLSHSDGRTVKECLLSFQKWHLSPLGNRQRLQFLSLEISYPIPLPLKANRFYFLSKCHFSQCRVEFGTIMLWYYVADRTTVFPQGIKVIILCFVSLKDAMILVIVL